MWLLNTHGDLSLRYFSTVAECSPYAILSHMWGQEEEAKEEVTFEDVQQSSFTNKTGFAKIQGCRKQAALDGYDWVSEGNCRATGSDEITQYVADQSSGLD